MHQKPLWGKATGLRLLDAAKCKLLAASIIVILPWKNNPIDTRTRMIVGVQHYIIIPSLVQ